MRSQNTFYFFITDAAGRSAYWENDIVKWSSIPRPLNYSPEGWKDIQPQFTRSAKYHGINRSMSTPFKFTKDGASILRYYLYSQQSYESKLYLNVNKWNDETDIYEAYYSAEIDLINPDDNSSESITANLIEGNILKLLNANDETDFEIPVTGVKVQLDGLQLNISQPIKIIQTETLAGGISRVPLPTVLLTPDGTPVYLHFNASPSFGVGDDQNWYLLYVDELAGVPQTFTITLSTFFTITSDVTFGRVIVEIWTLPIDDTTNPADNEVIFDEDIPDGDTEAFNFTRTVTLPPGMRFGIMVTIPFASAGETLLISEGSGLVTSESKYRSTAVDAVRPYDLYQALLAKVGADNRYTYTSTLLATYQHLVVTSVTAIRQLEGAVIKSSFAEFFKAFGNILFAGFGVNGLNLLFESRLNFYDPSTVTLDVGEVSTLHISVAQDQINNTVKVGYPPQDIESLNGLYSFNNTSKFKLPIYKVQKEYDATSPYLTDCYLIESKRINLAGKTTTDDRADNATVILNTVDAKATLPGVTFNYTGPNIFLLTGLAGSIADFAENNIFIIANSSFPDVFDGPYTVIEAVVVGSDLQVTTYENPGSTGAGFSGDIEFPLTLRRETYDSLTGVPTDTVYNIEDLTPKRMFMKHAPYFRSLTYWMNLEKAEFTTTDKNKDLITTLAGTVIAESTDVRVDKLGSPMFYPFIFTFKTRVPKTFRGIMYDAQNGHIQFNYNGFTFYGFPVQMSAKPDLNESQEWKLLASPANNLNQLIDIVINPTNNLFMSTLGMSFSRLNPVMFVPQGLELLPPYNFRHMDSWTNEQQKNTYPGYRPYCQPWQLSDNISLQCMTRDLGPVNVYLENKHGRVFGTYPLQNISTPAVQQPYNLYEGDINLAIAGIGEGCYRLRAVAGVGSTNVTFLSEWLNIRTEHPRTLLFEYSNDTNKSSTVFSTGYRPSFRFPGNIVDFVPVARFASYEDQMADIVVLDSVMYRKFTLLVGGSFGVPDWVIDKINAIMGLNSIDIDGKGFTRNEDAQFEPLSPAQGVTSKYWTIEIREAVNRDNTSVTTDGVLDRNAVMINVDTMLFGDLSSQASSNPVQVISVENN